MKFKILIVVSVVVAIAFTSCNNDTMVMGNWKTKAYFTGFGRANGTCFSIGNTAYYGMGKNDDKYLKDFYKYDVDKDAWDSINSFPGTPRAFNVSAATTKKGYVGLGYDGNVDLKDFWEFDPSTNKWTQLADFPGGVRRKASAFAIGDDIYVGLGTVDNDKKYMNDMWKYSNGTWSAVSSFPGEKRRYANVVILHGKAYVISGEHSGTLTDFWEYDPTKDKWRELDKLDDEDRGNSAVARYDACAFVSGGNIYLAGGTSKGSALSSIYEWSSTDSIWTEKTSIEKGTPRMGAGCFVVNDYGYIIGGHAGTNYLDDLYIFQPWIEKDLKDN